MGNITYANKVAGSSQWTAANANEVKSAVNSKADALAAMTNLTGTAWDGTTKVKTLTANTALTFSTSLTSGLLKILQDVTGGRTLTIGGVSIPIATTPSAVSFITFIHDPVNAVYNFSVDTSIVGNISGGGGGDTTAPMVISMTAVSANLIRVVFSENLATDAQSILPGWQFNRNGSNMNMGGAVYNGQNTINFTVTPNIVGGDTILGSYNSTTGDIKDAALNKLASFTNVAVTNNVGGGGYDTDAQAYITAQEGLGASYSTAQKDAINSFVVGEKAAGTWTSIRLAYLMLGTGVAKELNLKNPVDAYVTEGRMDLDGTWSRNANGITPVSAAAALMPMAADELLGNNGFYAFYTTSTGQSNHNTIGTQGADKAQLYPAFTDNTMKIGDFGGNAITDAPITDMQGLSIVNSNASNMRLYKGTTQIGNLNTPAANNLTSGVFTLNTTGGFTGTYSLVIIGMGLANADVAGRATRIQTLMTALGR